MTLGFTGTQRGMTAHQQERVRALLRAYKPDLFIHGGCVGADDQADQRLTATVAS
jgi:hypothetical protein